MWRERIFNPNVSLKTRGYQVANALLSPFVVGPLGISHVLEFPKSGGSWIRNMVRSYLGSEPFYNDRLLFRDAVIHGHRLHRFVYRRPIVVVRDPRDLYTSLYHHECHMDDRESRLSIERHFTHDPERSVDDDFEAYLRARLIEPNHPWFFFSQFVDSWAGRPSTCLVRYEDFLIEPETQLIRIVRFLGRRVDLDRIREAVEINSFAAQTRIRYGQERAQGEEDNSKFLRKGVAGDWRNHFNADACELFEKLEGPSLRRLGYERDASWVDAQREALGAPPATGNAV